MKEKLLYCVLFLVTYKCDGYNNNPQPSILGGFLSGAESLGTEVKEVLEGISQGGLNLQGQYELQPQQGNYHRPQGSYNNGNKRPQKPVETIVVVVEESPQNQGNPGYGQGYGYRPNNHYNRPNQQYRPGYDNGGGYQNGPWNYNQHQRPPPPNYHNRPGYGYNPQSPYNQGNYNGNGYYNNYGNNVPTYSSNQPFNNNNNGGNFNQNPSNIPTEPPQRPFNKPVNENNSGIPLDPINRPFDKPVNFNQGIPTQKPIQGESNNQNIPTPGFNSNAENNFDKKPIFTTENSLNNVEKTTKKPEGDDKPLFVPLNPDQYVYGGDKIEINAPKRETDDQKPASDDYSDSNIDPVDIRLGDKSEKQ